MLSWLKYAQLSNLKRLVPQIPWNSFHTQKDVEFLEHEGNDLNISRTDKVFELDSISFYLLPVYSKYLIKHLPKVLADNK